MVRAGKDFMISIEVDGVMQPICYATDCSISENYEVLEITGSQSKWRDYISDYAGYTLQVPGLQVYEANANILQMQTLGRTGTRFAWQATAFGTGGVVEQGFCIITSLTKTAQFRDAMRFDMSAIGCAVPETVFVPIQTTVYLSDFDKVQLAGCPNPYPVSIFWYDHTLIGLADNPDDVTAVFNEYSAANGGYYTLTSSVDGGCLFNMEIQYTAPQPYPTTVFAQPGAEFALSDNQTIDNALSPDQDADQALTPIA